MKERIIGRVKRVNGPVLIIKDIKDAMMMEMVKIGEQRLVGEVVKLYDGLATVQVYEDATALKPGTRLRHRHEPLGELGPGPRHHL